MFLSMPSILAKHLYFVLSAIVLFLIVRVLSKGLPSLAVTISLFQFKNRRLRRFALQLIAPSSTQYSQTPQNHALGLLRRGISVGVVPRRSSPTSEDPLSAIGKQSVTAVITHLAPP